MIGHDVLQRLALDDFDDAAEHVGGDRIAPLAARLEGERQAGDSVDHRLERRRRAAEIGGAIAGGGRAAGQEAVGEAGAVGEQVFEQHDTLGRAQRAVGIDDLHAAEGRQEGGEGVVEA